jgi:hypothetical protein
MRTATHTTELVNHATMSGRAWEWEHYHDNSFGIPPRLSIKLGLVMLPRMLSKAAISLH